MVLFKIQESIRTHLKNAYTCTGLRYRSNQNSLLIPPALGDTPLLIRSAPCPDPLATIFEMGSIYLIVYELQRY